MIYIIARFWPWLLPIFIVGVATATFTRQTEAKGKVAPWLIWCGLAFAAGAATVLLGVLLGRVGVSLETALASFVAYMFGAGAGALLRKGNLAEHEGWALGLIPAALLWFAGNIFEIPNVEADLKQSVGAAMKDAREGAQRFRIVGRDVAIPGDVADRGTLAATIRKIQGVRAIIETEETLAETPALVVAERAADVGEDAAEKAVEAGKKAFEADRGNVPRDAASEPIDAGVDAGKKPVRTVAKSSNSAAPTVSAEEKVAAAKSTLKTLRVSGPLDAATCQSALNATLALDRVEFRGAGTKISLASAYVLDRVAALLQRCPEQKVEVGVRADNAGAQESQALSRRRADKVVRYLVNEGVAAARLTGVVKPIGTNDEDGRGESGQIEFALK